MPIRIACASCKNAINVGDQFAGKRVKCPRCGQPMAVPAAVPAGAVTGSAAAAPAPRSSGVKPPPAPQLLTISCSGCAKQLKVKAELAGKAVKCPGCGKPIKVPAPAAPAANDGWIDVAEAVEPVAAGGATGDWGQALLQQQEVPDGMQDKIREDLGADERIVWCGRPDLDVMMQRAKRQRILGFLFLIAGLGVLGGAAFVGLTGALKLEGIAQILVPVFAGLISLFLAIYGFLAIGYPKRLERNAAYRPCYAISNRRLLIHPGEGMQMSFSRTGTVALDLNASSRGITSYTGVELNRLMRVEYGKHPGCGALILTRDRLERPGSGLVMDPVPDVHSVEKLIRVKLIHPIVDKMVRGEVSLKSHLGSRATEKNEDEETDLLPAEGNIKAFTGQLPTDAAHVKQLQSAVQADLSDVDPEDRARVEAELTDGEKFLWIGAPEGKTKGRGLFGTITGAAKRKEPVYTLYAITNRRALLWSEKDTAVGKEWASKDRERGPLCYYPPDLLDTGTEEDSRIPEGGSLLFKRVRVVIKTTRTDKRGAQTVSRTEELHCFGIIRIRNVKAVARLLFDTLIRPCKTS